MIIPIFALANAGILFASLIAAAAGAAILLSARHHEDMTGQAVADVADERLETKQTERAES